VADKGGERWGCLGGAGGVADLSGVVFGGSAGRKFREVIKVGKCVDWEGVVVGRAICSDSAKENTPS
jgi:hypothetical protein